MNPTPEYIAVIQRERESGIASGALARVAARVSACCDPSMLDRLARVLRRTPAC